MPADPSRGELLCGGYCWWHTVVGVQREGTWEVVGKNQIVVKGGAQDLALTLDEDGALSGQGGTFVRQK